MLGGGVYMIFKSKWTKFSKSNPQGIGQNFEFLESAGFKKSISFFKKKKTPTQKSYCDF